MGNNYKLTTYIQDLNASFDKALRNANDDPQIALYHLRKALECLVSIVWIRKQGIDILNPSNSSKRLALFDAMKDKRFSNCYDTLAYNDLNSIRILGNREVHSSSADKKKLADAKTANELIERFRNCVIKTESIVGLRIFDENKFNKPSVVQATPPVETKQPTTTKVETKKTTAEKGSSDYEASVFFGSLQMALDRSGNPFSISINGTAAAVNKKGSKAWLALDFLVKKEFLRIAIYIPDDTKTRYYDRLLAHRDEIEERLGYALTWLDKGEKSDKTRWIKTEKHTFIPYNYFDYKRLANDALPIIKKYVEVFSLYLPEAFR